MAQQQNFEKQLGYSFKDPALFELWRTHKSFAHEATLGQGHNERLEFLGDAVLEVVISEFLYCHFPLLSEGELSRLRSQLVSENSLAEVALSLGLGALLHLGKGEEKTGGRQKASLLSDGLEALLAAIYLDSEGSLTPVKQVILRMFQPQLSRSSGPLSERDHKTDLQELMQKYHKDTVHYQLLSQSGPEHDKIFEVAVLFQGNEKGRGSGKTKKQAEQHAAQNALSHLSTPNEPNHL